MSFALVAHPDADLRSEIRIRLEADGHQVTEVGEAEALRAALLDAVPEILVLDVALPGAVAIRMIPEIRGNPATTGIIILLVASIYDKHAWRRPARELHGADALVEPHRLDKTLLPRLRVRLAAKVARPGDAP